MQIAYGIIDADYRGDIGVALHNDSDEVRLVEHGDRIAQIILQPYEQMIIQEVSELSITDRAEGGFGSTGTR